MTINLVKCSSLSTEIIILRSSSNFLRTDSHSILYDRYAFVEITSESHRPFEYYSQDNWRSDARHTVHFHEDGVRMFEVRIECDITVTGTDNTLL